MIERRLVRARARDEQAFRELTDPYRRELQLHCYRILGSVQDAEDLLQETLLAAWRGLDRFEERASLRAWLYRIATNRCLNALRDQQRRPHDPGPPLEPRSAFPEPTRRVQPLWLEPYPDVLLDEIPDSSGEPEAHYQAKEALALAFVATLQELPPRQRAVLVLRDVVGFRAAEAAVMLETSETSVHSALQRARAAFEKGVPVDDQEPAPVPRSRRERELVARFTDAFERADIDALVSLLSSDATLTMPPEPLEYQGRAAIAGFFLDRTWWREQTFRLVPTRANTQPAFGLYLRDLRAPVAHAHGLMVLTLEGDQISAITRFGDNSLLRPFGLPRTLRN